MEKLVLLYNYGKLGYFLNSNLKVGLPGRTGKGETPSVIDILESGLLPNTPRAGEESVEDGVDDILVLFE